MTLSPSVRGVSHLRDGPSGVYARAPTSQWPFWSLVFPPPSPLKVRVLVVAVDLPFPLWWPKCPSYCPPLHRHDPVKARSEDPSHKLV